MNRVKPDKYEHPSVSERAHKAINELIDASNDPLSPVDDDILLELIDRVGSARELICRKSFTYSTPESLRASRLEYGAKAAPLIDDIMLDGIDKQLKHHRKECGYTQQKAAELSGVSYRSLQRIENGEKEPSLRELMALCALYGTSLDRVTGWLTKDETHFLDEAAMFRRDWMELRDRRKAATMIHELKQYFKLTNKQVAEGAVVSVDAISRILKADTTVKQSTLNKVFGFLADFSLTHE